MADKSTTNEPASPQHPSKNPNFATHTEGINPSAPSAGTAGWGTTRDEREAVQTDNRDATRAGQMKGNLGDDMATASQRASDAATTNKRRSEDTGDNQADLSRRTSVSAHSMNTSHGGTDHTFRCADAGNSDCRWETSGGTEDEVMQKVVEHARTDHGMSDWTDALHNRVRDAIRHRQAA
jgi:predicted small metal-binding protein